jgi:hypothetical protein
MKSIEATIQATVEKYIQNLCEKYNTLDPKDLEKIWNDITDNIQVDVKFKKSDEVKSSKSPKSPKVDTGTPVDEITMCQYVIQKGSKEGQKCGTKPKANSTFCSRHTKYEGVEQKTKKVIPQVKKSSKKSVVEKSSPKSDTSTKSKCKALLVLNKDINMHWHPESNIVFKMLEGKNTAVATYKDDKFYPLVEENIELCRKWNNNPYKVFTDEELLVICELKKEEKKPIEKVEDKKVADKPAKKSSTKNETKKSLGSSIADTKLQVKQVEEILDELQLSSVKDDVDHEDDVIESELDDPLDEDYIEEDE